MDIANRRFFVGDMAMKSGAKTRQVSLPGTTWHRIPKNGGMVTKRPMQKCSRRSLAAAWMRRAILTIIRVLPVLDQGRTKYDETSPRSLWARYGSLDDLV
jgi:hypothetical protein